MEVHVTPSLRIRAAGTDEGERVWALVDRYQREVGVVVPDTAERVLQARPGETAWLATDGNDDVGCALVRPLATVDGALELKRFYVPPEWRGRGIAAKLLQAAIDGARSAGWNAIYLDTTDDMTAARALYGRAGFTPCDRYNDNPQATTFMRLTLNGGA
jgi:GNAT superfamily N-acetyltransferase